MIGRWRKGYDAESILASFCSANTKVALAKLISAPADAKAMAARAFSILLMRYSRVMSVSPLLVNQTYHKPIPCQAKSGIRRIIFSRRQSLTTAARPAQRAPYRLLPASYPRCLNNARSLPDPRARHKAALCRHRNRIRAGALKRNAASHAR